MSQGGDTTLGRKSLHRLVTDALDRMSHGGRAVVAPEGTRGGGKVEGRLGRRRRWCYPGLGRMQPPPCSARAAPSPARPFSKQGSPPGTGRRAESPAKPETYERTRGGTIVAGNRSKRLVPGLGGPGDPQSGFAPWLCRGPAIVTYRGAVGWWDRAPLSPGVSLPGSTSRRSWMGRAGSTPRSSAGAST